MINLSKTLLLGTSLLFAFLFAFGCSVSPRDTLAGDDSNTNSDGDTDADNDADTDGDADGDADSDSDSDSDADSDSDSDSDGDADTDSDSDSDNDADADSDGDSDTDSDTDADADGDSDSDSDSDPPTGSCDGRSFEIKEGGYVCAGPMHGYAWVSSGDVSGANISPSDFESLSGGESELCVTGNTAADENWASVGILGMNVGQDLESSDDGSFTPSSSAGGIDVEVSINGDFGLRLQVKTTSGNEYCRSISNGSNSVSWENLTMECWEPGGTAYNGSDPISSVMLLVPGHNENEVNYDFCLEDLDIGDGGSSDADSDTDSDADSDGDTDTDSDSDSDSDYVPPTMGGQDGFATHYWDCCKASCGWSENAGGNPVESCDGSNNSMGGDYNQQSACSGGGAYQCWGFHPRAINSKYAVGWAAYNSGGCNTCYQLEFTGQSNSGYADPGAAALAGKVMIVQVVNIGGIQGNQFDLLVPGGGVGDFDACSTQWGGADLGDRYGGWFTQCRNQNAGNNQGAIDCVKNKCNSNFSGKPDLLEGCLFWADWAKVADNPTFKFSQVSCPSEISAVSGR